MITKRKNKKKVAVMFSGGLDSRLVIKLMQEQDFNVVALFFKLPFGAGCSDEKCILEFSKLHGTSLKIFDCTKAKLFQEYLDVIRHPKYGRGAGVNPCIDCRLFMMKKAKAYADKEGIELVVTGEVLGERPMSQTKKAMEIIEEESGLKGRLLRPLSAKFFPKTKAEEKGLIDRKKFYDIEGRRRQKQIKLAKKFKISYPHPAGGCLLCEKALKTRFEYLLKRGMDENEIKLMGVGRHFVINDLWIVLGRDEEENKIIEKVGKNMELVVPDFVGPSVVILGRSPTTKPRPIPKQVIKKVDKLIKAYSKKGSSEDRKKFDKWKL